MNRIFLSVIVLVISFQLSAQSISITQKKASIENTNIYLEFDLNDGTYSGIDKSDNTIVFRDAWYRIGQGGWKEPEYIYKAEHLGNIQDTFGEGKKLRMWYLPRESYDPSRFLDITVYRSKPFF